MQFRFIFRITQAEKENIPRSPPRKRYGDDLGPLNPTKLIRLEENKPGHSGGARPKIPARPTETAERVTEDDDWLDSDEEDFQRNQDEVSDAAVGFDFTLQAENNGENAKAI